MNKSIEDELFADILMCMKRISDFLGNDGKEEVWKYIERTQAHMEILKKNKLIPYETINYENMKYKVGDKVRIRKDLKANEIYNHYRFAEYMERYKRKRCYYKKCISRLL